MRTEREDATVAQRRSVKRRRPTDLRHAAAERAAVRDRTATARPAGGESTAALSHSHHAGDRGERRLGRGQLLEEPGRAGRRVRGGRVGVVPAELRVQERQVRGPRGVLLQPEGAALGEVAEVHRRVRGARAVVPRRVPCLWPPLERVHGVVGSCRARGTNASSAHDHGVRFPLLLLALGQGELPGVAVDVGHAQPGSTQALRQRRVGQARRLDRELAAHELTGRGPIGVGEDILLRGILVPGVLQQAAGAVLLVPARAVGICHGLVHRLHAALDPHLEGQVGREAEAAAVVAALLLLGPDERHVLLEQLPVLQLGDVHVHVPQQVVLGVAERVLVDRFVIVVEDREG
mmetsp:Transcript_68697/g.182526  ORF Transcript_68697/g.182526 Transcript_68697/m.182526 type:complete len:348 (+) Transcript_68697:186-1229(+)